MNANPRELSDRLALVASRVTRTQRLLLVTWLLLPVVFILGAAAQRGLEDLKAKSLEIQDGNQTKKAWMTANGDGGLTGSLTVDGDLKIKGNVLVQGTDVTNALTKIGEWQGRKSLKFGVREFQIWGFQEPNPGKSPSKFQFEKKGKVNTFTQETGKNVVGAWFALEKNLGWDDLWDAPGFFVVYGAGKQVGVQATPQALGKYMVRAFYLYEE